MPLVLITDYWTGDPDVERQVLGDVATIEVLGATREDELLPHLPRADALFVWHHVRLTRLGIDCLSAKCRIIARCGVGFDNVDGAAARERNIPLCNTPDYGTEDVADHAIGLMLSLVRRLHDFNDALRRDPRVNWTPQVGRPLVRLRGRTFGVVGLGRIGTAAALRAKAFGMHVVFYDPYKPDGYDKALGIERVEWPALLARSDVVSLHVPLTTETRHMIDATALARMRPRAIVINTARGAVCDADALVAAIAAGRVGGAGLDVLPTEPPALDSAFVNAWRNPAHAAHGRVLVTPHAAFYTEEGFVEMRRKCAEEVRRALLGERLHNVVN